MKQYIKIIGLALTVMTLSMCSDRNERLDIDEFSKKTFTAVSESGSDTKTILNEEWINSERPVLWLPQDAIGISADGGAFSKFIYEGTEITGSAAFTGSIGSATEYLAMYPYSETASIGSGIISMTLPSTQSFLEANIGGNALPMVSKSSDKSFTFRHLCGIFEISLSGNATVSSITLTMPSAIAGAGTVDMSYTDTPVLTMSSEGSKTITLDCGTGVTLSPTAPTSFYLILPPGTYAGFSFTVNTSTGSTITKTSEKNLTIERGKILHSSSLTITANTLISEREALVALYNSTDGDNWVTNTNWCSSEPISEWYGVTVENGHVTEINLNYNHLIGVIPPEIAALSHLSSLNVGNWGNNETSCNKITSIDISGNTSLTELYCYDNQLTSLDVSSNTSLIRLECLHNQLTSLDISSNTSLLSFDCSGNPLTSLDVSSNTSLIELSCQNNQLTSLDVSSNTSLKYLYCDLNQLTSLDISSNTSLIWLYCYSNQLTSLDVSSNTELTDLRCSDNRLSVIDIRNLVNLGYNVYVGSQTNASGEETYVSLILTESQLTDKWTPTWSTYSENARVNTSVQ